MLALGRAVRYLRRWPVVDAGNGVLPGEVMNVTLDELRCLMEVARGKPWSATGRPTWISENGESLAKIFLVVFNVASPGVYRCLVIVLSQSRSGRTFSLDVSVKDFWELTALSRSEGLRLAQFLLHQFPMVPLDPEQEAAWEAME